MEDTVTLVWSTTINEDCPMVTQSQTEAVEV